jgi:SsrA-binding protein
VGVADQRKAGAPEKTLSHNRAASHEFHLLSRYEAGIVLTGTEVKSARLGGVSLKEAFAKVERGEIFLHNAHFSPYEQGNRENVDPRRTRKLLLHASEIRKLERETQSGGTTLVPTKLYLKNGRVKLELAIAKGKKSHDKREATREREVRREMDRARSARSR